MYMYTLVEIQGIVGASLCVCIHSGGEPARVHTQYSIAQASACINTKDVHRD